MRPGCSQYIPGEHCVHSLWYFNPVMLLNVPWGQWTGVSVPSGQNIPSGHRRPMTPSVGVGIQAPPIQWYPALQLPVYVGDDPDEK